VDPYHGLTDPDSAFFVCDLQDANKNISVSLSFLLITF